MVGYYGGFRNIELRALKFGYLLDGAGNATAEKVLEMGPIGFSFIDRNKENLKF